MKRLDELALEYGFSPAVRDRYRVLLELVADEHSPTSVRDPREGVDVHIADSLVALRLEDVRGARSIADIGSGAGFPGLVLGLAQPETQIFLVESLRRKCDFLTNAVTSLELTNVEVICERAESWSDGLGVCDVVTARAVASLSVLCEYAAPLLREGGTFVAWKGRVEPSEETDGLAAAHALGLEVLQPLPVTPYKGSRDRVLRLYRKTAPTPATFPRRPGLATKRPLSAKKHP